MSTYTAFTNRPATRMRIGRRRQGGDAKSVVTVSVILDGPAQGHLDALAAKWSVSQSERLRLAIDYTAEHLAEAPAHDSTCWPGARSTCLHLDERANLALHRIIDHLGGAPKGAKSRAIRFALWFAARDVEAA